jgi:C4-dicarboxylate transporter
MIIIILQNKYIIKQLKTQSIFYKFVLFFCCRNYLTKHVHNFGRSKSWLIIY